MNSALALLLLLLVPQEPDAVDLGAAAYRDARWAEAYAAFSDALEAIRSNDPSGAVTPGALEFALGASAEQLGELPRALWHYRRAEARLSGDPMLVQRLALVESRAGLPIGGSAAPRPRLPVGWWVLLALGLAAEGYGLWIGLRRNRFAGLLLMLGGTAAAIPVLVGPGAAPLGGSHPSAVVLVEGQGVRAQPHGSLPTGTPLAAGSGVEVLARSDRWARIRAQDAQGWIPAASLGLVDESEPPLR